MMGAALYEEFFAGYTAKQWGRSPTELPASILKRLPMRFDYNDRYFSDPYEAMPVDGYTAAIERILQHERIDVRLSTLVGADDVAGFDHVVWTGPIDAFFDHVLGRLAYRTLDFEWHTDRHPFQGCSVMNYCEADVEHTRIAEHNYFEPWAEHQRSVIGVETSRECEPDDIPYYPVRLAHDQELLEQYVELARQTGNVTFVGRLGTYRYLDMDATIHEALEVSAAMLRAFSAGRPVGAFHVDPLG
jgi:UDP-galactopyranose mutase